ncbi:response regulator transcription factor [Serratia proteamaculans]|uniref:response regulator transcription factor n=1 Tax=Serratia proteamaculans TaxID=28151 RepID=UPI0014324933|nr:response regulator transcription factor [Serratia proteamaculans]
MVNIFPYEYVLILERNALFAHAIATVVTESTCLPASDIQHVSSIMHLRSKIMSKKFTGKTVLIIAELVTDVDGLRNGFELIKFLTAQEKNGNRQYGVVVYTGLREAILIKGLVVSGPDAIVLRDEPFAEFEKIIAGLCLPGMDIKLSSGTRKKLSGTEETLTAAEQAWLIAEIDSGDPTAAAIKLHCSRKTVSTHRISVAKKLGLRKRTDFCHWLGEIQCSLGYFNGRIV